MSDSNGNKSPIFFLTILIALALLCVVGTYCIWSKNLGIGYGGTTETWAHFGSFFGGVLGPILSFFSFVGVIYTIYLQSKSNKQQAQANRQTAVAAESSEKLAEKNIKEQEKLHLNQISYDKQKRLLDILLRSIDRVETAGENAVLDLTTKDDNNDSKLGPYFNTYNWRAQVFAIELNSLKDKIDKESAEIIISYLEKISGQLNNFCTNGLKNIDVTFSQPQKQIEAAINNLESHKTKIDTIKEYLGDKYSFK
ncbi:hypothetical protein NH514_04750 [Pseudoalteromonas sp. ACER1]|uniref:hypothetical protein n=1 Tax=unclassified Pseudoalteromonas TaxID=194690 RepID=UPI001F3703F6|nr:MULTISPECIES: hypothetical protein [unclassified Pseudoalteromonas]MCF2846575.1 hypothetical protein [Pseudoalteromonas sp. PAST1]MCO7210046.1 hypothetical protein [Pseudoalteromonas sp. ACER1]